MEIVRSTGLDAVKRIGGLTMKSQLQQILAHLKSGKTNTQGEAIDLCKCYRLATVIYRLRHAGYDIERTQPEHSHITLHIESLLKLFDGIKGEYEPQPQREIFKLLAIAKEQGIKP